jgi:hypothetical protein
MRAVCLQVLTDEVNFGEVSNGNVASHPLKIRNKVIEAPSNCETFANKKDTSDSAFFKPSFIIHFFQGNVPARLNFDFSKYKDFSITVFLDNRKPLVDALNTSQINICFLVVSANDGLRND